MKNLREALTALLRQQNDRTNLIESVWLLYAVATHIPIKTVQWTESRRCFFAGALTLFESVMMVLDSGTEPTESDLFRMDRIAKELERFREELTTGTV